MSGGRAISRKEPATRRAAWQKGPASAVACATPSRRRRRRRGRRVSTSNQSADSRGEPLSNWSFEYNASKRTNERTSERARERYSICRLASAVAARKAASRRRAHLMAPADSSPSPSRSCSYFCAYSRAFSCSCASPTDRPGGPAGWAPVAADYGKPSRRALLRASFKFRPSELARAGSARVGAESRRAPIELAHVEPASKPASSLAGSNISSPARTLARPAKSLTRGQRGSNSRGRPSKPKRASEQAS